MLVIGKLFAVCGNITVCVCLMVTIQGYAFLKTQVLPQEM